VTTVDGLAARACLVAGDDGPLRAALCGALERDGARVAAVPLLTGQAEVAGAVARAREDVGTIEAFVAIPPGGGAASVEELSPAVFGAAIDAACKSPLLFTQALLGDLRASGAGRLIYVISAAGILGRAYTAHVAAGARAAWALMRTVALEEAPAVTANAVAVGPMAGDPLLAARARALVAGGHAAPGDAERAVAERLPLGRLVDPREVAEAVLWGLRPESAFLSGQTIAVASGGELQVWP
jgi:NAD(P)-dependent dehydrogenase (short-subunit alcohol dehydrogenase family)